MGEVIKIPLTRGEFALIDEQDYDLISQHRWYAVKTPHSYYAATSFKHTHKIYMHRIILNPPTGLMVDHVNKNGLDNRRCNIRICTRSQNGINRESKHGSLSKFKGVTWNYRDGLWYATIKKNQVTHRLGAFKNEIDAAIAYDIAALELYGDFAVLNLSQAKAGDE